MSDGTGCKWNLIKNYVFLRQEEGSDNMLSRGYSYVT